MKVSVFEPHNSLNVACLKRLLPIGLGFFSGWEQELLQHAKHKLMKVSALEPHINSLNDYCRLVWDFSVGGSKNCYSMLNINL